MGMILSKSNRWLIILAFLVIVLAGCQEKAVENTPVKNDTVASEGEKQAAKTEQAPVKEEEVKEQDPYAENIAINWMNHPGYTMEQGAYVQSFLEERFNVTISPQLASNQADFIQKQQIALGSGQIPDVIYIFEPSHLQRFANQGLLLQIEQADIESYAPRLKQRIDTFAPHGWFYSQLKGENYGIPTTYFSGQFSLKNAWRKDLLEKAGITEIPETLEAFEAAFAALKENGVYGMSTNYTQFFNQFQSIFGAYGVMPLQWMEQDGSVINGAVTEQARDALTLLADWYKKGYIHPEFVTGQDLNTKFLGGEFAYRDFVMPNEFGTWAAQLADANLEGEIVQGISPVGPGGQGSWSWGTAGHIIAFGKHLKNEPEKLARILSILDEATSDEEVYKALYFGLPGEHFEFVQEGDYTAGLVYPVGAERNKFGIIDPGVNSPFTGQADPDLIEKYSSAETLKIFRNENYPIQDLFGKSDVLPSAGTYWNDLVQFQIQEYTKFIRGDVPMTAFDQFVEQWNQAGGAILTEEANELYRQ